MWREVGRQETRHFAEILGICGFAITQPVLASFGEAAEHFAFRGATDAEIISFPILVALLPAALLTLPGLLARLVSHRFAGVVHLATLAIVAFAAVLQGIDAAFATTGVAKALIAVVVTAAATWLFARFDAALQWARIASAFSLLFVGAFLFASPVGELAFADPPKLVELVVTQPADPVDNGSASEAPTFPDIVMIVLDELPTGIVVDSTGGIDAVRYPSLAKFADEATWYRTNTTVSAQTTHAVPAMMSGQLPNKQFESTWAGQPDTLFRLLGGTYHLTVSEALTRLCPRDWCGTSPLPPPAPPVEIGSTDSETSDTETPVAGTAGPAYTTPGVERDGLLALLGDAVDIWREQVALDPDRLPPFSGFREEVTTPVGPTTTTSTTAPIQDEGIDPEIDPLDRVPPPGDELPPKNVISQDRAQQIPRVEQFIDAIRPSDQPTLYYLHVVLPHQPFVLTETGARYEAKPLDDDLLQGGFEWENAVTAQRMALQMMFTDQLLGDIIARIRDQGLYDDALVIVTADHGATVASEGFYRYYNEDNAADLMFTPLMIKFPNQREGMVSEAPSEVVDIVPTIADVLDVDIPWDVDGASLLDRDAAYVDPECHDQRRLTRFGIKVLGHEEGLEVFEFCRNELIEDGLRPVLGELRESDEWATAGLARLTPFADLLGTAWDDLDAQPSDGWASLERAGELRDGSSPPIGGFRGAVHGDVGAEWVAVAINGRIAAISAIHELKLNPLLGEAEPATDRFSVIVPSPLLTESGYDIRVAALEVVDGKLIAAELVIDP